MLRDRALELSDRRLEFSDVLLRNKRQLHLLQVLLAHFELSEQVLHLLSLFLQFFGSVDIFTLLFLQFLLRQIKSCLDIGVVAHSVGDLGLF